LDHYDKTSKETFKLRYWTNKKYFDTDVGPIFFYICGEWTCAPPSDDAAAMAYGASRSAMLVTLEHRYYGASQPFETWSFENLLYLDTAQALADIHAFKEMIVQQAGGDRQTVLIGGSYPGAVVAWYQHIFNDASAVWSSSGVINAITNFTMFDYDIYDQANKTAGCKEVIANLTNQIDAAFQDGKQGPILEMFGVTNKDIVYGDFMFYIADIFTMGV
jgi:serine protease 16